MPHALKNPPRKLQKGTKNEQTSSRVGAIAGRMLTTTATFSANEPLAIVVQRKQRNITKGTLVWVGRVGELKALAASALTQRPARRKKKRRRLAA